MVVRNGIESEHSLKSICFLIKKNAGLAESHAEHSERSQKIKGGSTVSLSGELYHEKKQRTEPSE